MKGFIYTLTATMFVTIALAILLLVSNYYYKDTYSNTLFLQRLSTNTLNLLGVNLYYNHGTVFEIAMPTTSLSLVSTEINSFYSSYDNHQVSVYLTYPIVLHGPFNVTILSNNHTNITFDGNATVVVNCNCSSVTAALSNGGTYYNITIITNNGTKKYVGYLSGKIDCNECNLTLGDGYIDSKGHARIKYYFDTEGTFLSNIQYFTNIDGQRVYGFLNVRT